MLLIFIRDPYLSIVPTMRHMGLQPLITHTAASTRWEATLTDPTPVPVALLGTTRRPVDTGERTPPKIHMAGERKRLVKIHTRKHHRQPTNGTTLYSTQS